MEHSPGVGPAHGITVTQDDGAVLVRLHGDIDASLRGAASRAMVAVVACDGPLVLDTSAVTFIDSSGLAFLLQVHGVVSEAGRPVTLRDPSRAVLDLLALVGLDGIFPAPAPAAPAPAPAPAPEAQGA